MNSPDAMQGYKAILPDGVDHLSSIPARLLLSLPFLHPGSAAAYVKAPIFFAICAKDNVAPPQVTFEYARKAINGTIKVYEEMGHFDIYIGKNFDIATKDYVEFLKKNLPL
jgi:cephalosporin-C deacetylase-like acetyl esterase